MSAADLSRRALLGAALVAAGGLSGCGVRLEDDAPRIPFVPTRVPVAAESWLTGVVADSVALAERAARVTPSVRGLADAHREQARVLGDALRYRSVPHVPTPAASSSGPTGVARDALAREEGRLLPTRGTATEAETALHPLLLTLLAQRYAAVLALTGKEPLSAPTGSAWAAPAPLVPVLEAARQAHYAGEVIAAQAPRGDEQAVRDTLAALTRVTRELATACGDAAPPAPLGGVVPPAGRTGQRFGKELDRLRTALGAALPQCLAADPDRTWSTVLPWLGTIEGHAVRWGRPAAPFPGLR